MEDDGTDDSSSVDGSADESSDASSIDGIEERGHKRLKLQEKIEEDRISALPDSLIQHILSFLPSTEEAIRTGVLSKRWLNQWTRVPVLIFLHKKIPTFNRRYVKNFIRFVGNTLLLYDRYSKIRKFHIYCDFERDVNFTSKLRFATSRDVEELILDNMGNCEPYMLPKFIFDNACLLKLQILNCDFHLSWRINWPSLKTLKMDGLTLTDSQKIENVLSGSPSLESLEICNLYCDDSFVIASESLKILIMLEIDVETSCGNLDISCPNLEELCVQTCEPNFHSVFPAKTLQHVLSTSPLLHSLELKDCFFHQLVIASKSLKRLVLYECCDFKISCPNLEVLNLCGSNMKTCKSILRPPNSAMLHFVPPFEGRATNFGIEILEELKPVKELKVLNWVVKILPALEIAWISNPLLNLKYLTLDCPNFKHISGILHVLCCSPALESLVIKLHNYKYRKTADLELNNFEETFRNANETAFTCLASHLKTVKIIGLSKRDGKFKVILQFVEFLLKNARVLEKMVVILEDGGMNFLGRVSRKVSSFSRCSPQCRYGVFVI